MRSRHDSYFQLCWSCKKHWGRWYCEVIHFLHPPAPFPHSFHTTRNRDGHTMCYLTKQRSEFIQSCCTLPFIPSPMFLFAFSLHFLHFLPFLSLQFCSCVSTSYLPFLGRIVAWWIVTSSNITAVCSMTMPRDRARVRHASTKYPVAGYRTLPSMQWPTK